MSSASMVRVGRQAIFDRDRAVFGYELLFRASDTDGAELRTTEERDAATSQVLTAALGDFGAGCADAGARLFVNLTRAFVVGGLPLAVAPGDFVLEVTEDVLVDDEVLAGLRSLRAAGHVLAIDDFEGEEHRLPSLPLAQFVKLVLAPGGEARLAELVALVRQRAPQAQLVVERVETAEDFQTCLDLGIDLFQGYWLQRPVVLTSRALDTSRTTAVQLLCLLADPGTPARDIERVVLSDAALSLKVLRVASSSAVATRAPITSVRQAIVLLGPRMLSAWAALTVLGSSPAGGSQRATTAFVLARAGSCARLAEASSQEAYTVGLLSGAAEALGTTTADLLASVHLREDLRAALTRFEGPVGQALAAVLRVDASSPAAPGAAPVQAEVGTAYASALAEAVSLSSALS